MDNKIKLIIVGLVVILAISLFIALQNYSARQGLQREKDKLSEENELLNNKINKLEGTLRDNEKKIQALNTDISRIAQEKKQVENELGSARKGQEDLMEKIKAQQASESKIVKDKADLESQLGKLRSDLNAVRLAKEQLQMEKDALEIDIDNLRRNKGDLGQQREYEEREEAAEVVSSSQPPAAPAASGTSVELPPIVVRPQKKATSQAMGYPAGATEYSRGKVSGAMASRAAAIETDAPAVETPARESPVRRIPRIEAAAIDGKVLAVMRDNNFVVIDLGEESGVRVGDVFGVYRKGKKFAAIEAIRTAKNVSACDIKEENKSILVGDVVK